MKIKWNAGLFGSRWTEVNGYKISQTRTLGVIVEATGPDGLPLRRNAVVFTTPDANVAIDHALALPASGK